MKLYKEGSSKINRKGLFANKDIKNGTKIINYIGKIITKKQTDENPKFDNGKAIYLYNLNDKYDLDGDFKYNTARLINHSCNPNCEVRGKGLKLWISAIKDIKKVMNYLMTMDLALTKIIKISHVNVEVKIVVALSLEKDLDGD